MKFFSQNNIKVGDYIYNTINEQKSLNKQIILQETNKFINDSSEGTKHFHAKM